MTTDNLTTQAPEETTDTTEKKVVDVQVQKSDDDGNESKKVKGVKTDEDDVNKEQKQTESKEKDENGQHDDTGDQNDSSDLDITDEEEISDAEEESEEDDGEDPISKEDPEPEIQNDVVNRGTKRGNDGETGQETAEKVRKS